MRKSGISVQSSVHILNAEDRKTVSCVNKFSAECDFTDFCTHKALNQVSAIDGLPGSDVNVIFLMVNFKYPALKR